MRLMFLLATLVVFAVVLSACSSDPVETNNPAAIATASPNQLNSQLTAVASGTATISPTSSSVTPNTVPLVGIQPPTFDLSDYANGSEVMDLFAEVGPERAWPGELGNDAPPLPEDEVKRLVIKFLADSRVFTVFSSGLKNESSIGSVTDYCDNHTTIERFPFGSEWRGQQGVYIEGVKSTWNIGFGGFNPWNSPYLTGPIPLPFVAGFIGRGLDAVGFSRFGPAGENGIIRQPSETRVFDNPDCEDPLAVVDYSAESWALIGMEDQIRFPDGITIADQQMDREALLATWDDIFKNSATFDNYNGWPVLYFCDDYRGIELSEDSPALGEQFTWSLRDGSSVAPNGIWLKYDYDHPNIGDREQFIYLPVELDPLRTIVPVNLSECSIETGVQYVEQISERLDWLDERGY